MTATTRATVNRVVRDLEKAGVIEVGRGRVRIADRPTLSTKAR
jgi:DNA-binding transcriptional regulator YhcF (GntR family)